MAEINPVSAPDFMPVPELRKLQLEKLQKLGLYRHLNADTIGYHGDINEEADRSSASAATRRA